MPLLIFDSIQFSEALCKDSSLEEILWNFARLKDGKRLTLSQNPHFYTNHRDNFRWYPTRKFLEPTRIYVLTARPGRIYVEPDRKMKIQARAFDNVWVPHKALIFKGSCCHLFKFPCLSTIFQTFAESSRVIDMFGHTLEILSTNLTSFRCPEHLDPKSHHIKTAHQLP